MGCWGGVNPPYLEAFKWRESKCPWEFGFPANFLWWDCGFPNRGVYQCILISNGHNILDNFYNDIKYIYIKVRVAFPKVCQVFNFRLPKGVHFQEHVEFPITKYNFRLRMKQWTPPFASTLARKNSLKSHSW